MNSLYVLAWIGTQRVAFDATGVEAVVDIAMVVPVPLAAAHVVGLAAIRSQVITVIDCGVATGGGFSAPTGRAIVTAIDGHRYALRVDQVDDVISGTTHAASDHMQLGPAWRALAVGIIEIEDGFALVIDPASLIAAVPAAIAA
jgi:purine-binding chemotaxis protein CheW